MIVVIKMIVVLINIMIFNNVFDRVIVWNLLINMYISIEKVNKNSVVVYDRLVSDLINCLLLIYWVIVVENKKIIIYNVESIIIVLLLYFFFK